MTRRNFLLTAFGATATMLASACARPSAPAPAQTPQAPQPTAPPAATQQPSAPAAGKPAAAAPAKPAEAPAKPAEAPVAGAPAKDTWTIAMNAEVTGLDPAIFGGYNTDAMLLHIMDGLVDLVGGDLKVVPRLATRWERTNDLTWRFELRKGVKFHNGQEMKAEDVKYSIEEQQKKESIRSPNARLIAQVNVVNDYAVDIVNTQPSSAFIGDLPRLFIVPKAVRVQLGPDQFRVKPIGTGPYKVVSWTANDRLILEAFPDHWRGAARPKNLVIRPITEPTTRVAELETGGVDMIYNPPASKLNEVAKHADTDLLEAKGARTVAYLLAVTKPPFNDVRVRRALNYAIDRKAILETVLEGRGVLLAGPLSQGWSGYTPDLQPYPYDPARAKALLAEAGLANGFNTSWKHTQGTYLADSEIAQAIAGQLRQIGVNIDLIPTEQGQGTKDQAEGNFDGIISGAWSIQSDPGNMMSWWFTDKPHFVIPKLKELAQAGQAQADPEKREKTFQEFNRAAHDEACWLFLHAQDEFWGKRKEIAWKPSPLFNGKGYSYYFDASGLKSV